MTADVPDEKDKKSKDKAPITGDVHLRITYIPPIKNNATKENGELEVEVVAARNLTSCDRNGLVDPYIQILFRKYEKRTKVVKKNLNPTFNEKIVFKVKSDSPNGQSFDEGVMALFM